LKADFETYSEKRQSLRRNKVDIPIDDLDKKELEELIGKYL